MLELHGVTADMRARVFSDREHLTQVRLGLGMAFETVLVSALLLADLAVPSQPLKPLGLHFVGEVLRCSDCKVIVSTSSAK